MLNKCVGSQILPRATVKRVHKADCFNNLHFNLRTQDWIWKLIQLSNKFNCCALPSIGKICHLISWMIYATTKHTSRLYRLPIHLTLFHVVLGLKSIYFHPECNKNLIHENSSLCDGETIQSVSIWRVNFSWVLCRFDFRGVSVRTITAGFRAWVVKAFNLPPNVQKTR